MQMSAQLLLFDNIPNWDERIKTQKEKGNILRNLEF